MLCRSCGQENDPSRQECVRCRAPLSWPISDESDHLAPSGTYPLDAEQAHGVATSYGPGRTRSTWAWPVVAGMVVVAAAVVTVVAITRGGNEQVSPPQASVEVDASTQVATAQPTQGPASATLDQASGINRLLDSSVASRARLNAAIQQVDGCVGITAATADMREIGQERRNQIASVNGLDLSALPNGDLLRSTLRQALQQSLYADESFVRWAEYVARVRCRGSAPHNADYTSALAHSEAAGVAKNEFLAVWNPLAVSVGLQARSRSDI